MGEGSSEFLLVFMMDKPRPFRLNYHMRHSSDVHVSEPELYDDVEYPEAQEKPVVSVVFLVYQCWKHAEPETCSRDTGKNVRTLDLATSWCRFCPRWI